jgi:uncharacterized protein
MLPNVKVHPLVADLGTDAGVDAVAAQYAREELTMLVNNAGVAHYMPFAELPAGKASERLHVKVVAPTMLARAAVAGMIARGEGTIINVSGMLAFSGPAPIETLPLRRAAGSCRQCSTRRSRNCDLNPIANIGRMADERRRATCGLARVVYMT